MAQELKKVEFSLTPRFSSGIDEIDWLMGGGRLGDGVGTNLDKIGQLMKEQDGDFDWGFPRKKISLWKGPSGAGKSRALIEIAKKVSNLGFTVLYFQNEVNLSDFRAWVGDKDDDISSTFLVSEAVDIRFQLEEIKKTKADLVIVDSVNQMKEFGNGCKSAINGIYECYREVISEIGSHVIFICQLDKQNGIKGGAELSYLCDTIVDVSHLYSIDKIKIDNHFVVKIDGKNRGSRTDSMMYTIWKHTGKGAECISRNRLYDIKWCVPRTAAVQLRYSWDMYEDIYREQSYIEEEDDEEVVSLPITYPYSRYPFPSSLFLTDKQIDALEIEDLDKIYASLKLEITKIDKEIIRQGTNDGGHNLMKELMEIKKRIVKEKDRIVAILLEWNTRLLDAIDLKRVEEQQRDIQAGREPKSVWQYLYEKMQ